MSLSLAASATAVTLFATAMVYSAIKDVLTMEVSDRLVGLLLFAFPVLAVLSGWPVETIAVSAGAAFVVFLASLACFSAGWIGGGDGKLVVAAVLWLGAEQAGDFLLYTALFGGLCALGLVAFRKLDLPTSFQARPWVARLRLRETGVPYAVAIGIAGLIVLPDTPWMGSIV